MGNLSLTLDTPLDIRKVVISIMFRIPEATAELVRSPNVGLADDRFCMQNFVPIISFGPQQTITRYEFFDTVLHDPAAPPMGHPLAYYDGTVAFTTPSGPTFIGAYYRGETGLYADGSIVANIQTIDAPTLTGVWTDISDATYDDPSHGGVGWVDVTDDGSHWFEQPDVYFGSSRTGPSAADFRATTEVWHHLLISWDVTNGCSSHGNVSPFPDDNFVDTVSKMWVAFDDRNYNQRDLPAKWANDVSDEQSWGDNDIVSQIVSGYAGLRESGFGLPESALTISSIPSNPIRVPGPPSQVYQADAGVDVTINSVQSIQLAELQIFTGVTLDTSIEDNRRAFIKTDGTPERNHALAEALLGKSPEVRLSGDAFWKTGVNSGTAGNFTRTGTLNTYATSSPDISP